MKWGFGCEEEGNMIKVSPNDEIIDAWALQVGEVDHAGLSIEMEYEDPAPPLKWHSKKTNVDKAGAEVGAKARRQRIFKAL